MCNDRILATNRRLAQWRMKWLIEHLPAERQVLPRINFCGVLTVLCSETRHCAKRQSVIAHFKKDHLKKITTILTLLILISCSTTKNLKEDKLLGTYHWNGIYGVGASIQLKKDGVFEYNWVTGLVNGTTIGTWTLERRKIKLNSEFQPYTDLKKDFEIIKTEQSDTSLLTLKVLDTNDNPIYFANCFLAQNNKVIESSTTDFNGFAKLNKMDSDSLTIQFVGYKTVKIKYDKTVSHYEIQMKEVTDYYEYFTDKVFILKNDRLYDRTIIKDKYVRKNYYERQKNGTQHR
jgi:hypothetical protein